MMNENNKIDLDRFKERFELVEKFAKDRKIPEKFGYFGPNSMIWKVNQEFSLVLGTFYSLWMQESHPWVSTSMYYHSNFLNDPFGRLSRTADFINIMTRENQKEAYNKAFMLYKIHSKVFGKLNNGENYEANNSEAMRWVASTLAYANIKCYDNTVGKLSLREKNDYYQEFKNFYYMFGVDPQIVPENWNDFIYYYKKMIYSGDLEVNNYARVMLRHFLNQIRLLPTKLKLPANIFLNYSISLLPKHIREDYGFKYSFKERMLHETTQEAIKYLYPKIPIEYRCNISFLKRLRENMV